MSSKHRTFMKMAIEEARKCRREDERTHPMVGAVVVKDGKLLATGYRGELSPGEHAEFTVIERKLREAILTGSTVYTTLEPCTTRNHPKVPCAERLIERKVSRVFIGMLDPDPEITGKGQRRLREANITTELFPPDLMSIVEEINRFFTREKKRSSTPDKITSSIVEQSIINNQVNLKRSEDLGMKVEVQEPLIKCLLPIQDALAGQPDEDRWKPIYWPDLIKLYRREECDLILRLLEASNVVLIQGYPASGKSCTVYKLFFDLIKERKRTYYGNLTTRLGLFQTAPQDLPNKLITETRNITQETFIIIEDIHHSPTDFEQLSILIKNPQIKLVLTTRPL